MSHIHRTNDGPSDGQFTSVAMSSDSSAIDESKPYVSSSNWHSRQEPFCFVVDIDSVLFILDTGANHIIINDAKLLDHLSSTSAKVRGIEDSTAREGVSCSYEGDCGTIEGG